MFIIVKFTHSILKLRKYNLNTFIHIYNICIYIYFFAPMAHGSFQARSRIGATAAGLQLQQHKI